MNLLAQNIIPWVEPEPDPINYNTEGGGGFYNPNTTFGCDYYADIPVSAGGHGAPGNTGAIDNPWDLQTALGKTSELNGKILGVRGGVHYGKFRSTLNNATVRGIRGEFGDIPQIDGNFTTTLTASMTSNQTTFQVADGSMILNGSNVEVWINNEIITVLAKSGNNITSCLRNADGTIGGATTHANGATVTLIGGKQLEVVGNNTRYWGLECLNSNLARGDGAVIEEKFRGHGIFNNGNGNSFINNILHDNVDGFFTGSSGQNTIAYGNIVFNNGLVYASDYPTTSPIGAGMYCENSAGYLRVWDNIVFNSYRNNIQLYGRTGPLIGANMDGSVCANAGSPTNIFTPNLIFGADTQSAPTGVLSNSVFYHRPNANSGDATISYGAGITSATVTNNYFIGGQTSVEVQNTCSTCTFTGNKFHITNTSGINVQAAQKGASYTWNSNTYYNTASNAYKFGNVTAVENETFAQWKTATGYDSLSSINSGVLPNTVIIRPNAYETGRAHIIVMTPTPVNTVTIDLAQTGFPKNHNFTIKNVLRANLSGWNVVDGTYNGGSQMVTIPLTTNEATSVPTPIGGAITPASTLPYFAVFILQDAGAI